VGLGLGRACVLDRLHEREAQPDRLRVHVLFDDAPDPDELDERASILT
jgi:hypothetical protein